MSVKFTDNTAQLHADVDNKTSLAIRFMLDAVHRESIPGTPKRHGNLRADVLKAVKGNLGSIAWDKNYAVYQEDKQFTNYTTPGTGPHFALKAVQKVTRDASKYFKQAGIS